MTTAMFLFLALITLAVAPASATPPLDNVPQFPDWTFDWKPWIDDLLRTTYVQHVAVVQWYSADIWATSEALMKVPFGWARPFPRQDVEDIVETVEDYPEELKTTYVELQGRAYWSSSFEEPPFTYYGKESDLTYLAPGGLSVMQSRYGLFYWFTVHERDEVSEFAFVVTENIRDIFDSLIHPARFTASPIVNAPQSAALPPAEGRQAQALGGQQPAHEVAGRLVGSTQVRDKKQAAAQATSRLLRAAVLRRAGALKAGRVRGIAVDTKRGL